MSAADRSRCHVDRRALGKEKAAPTFKRGFGFHPLWAFVDHGEAGTGELVAVMLRPGNAGSNTAIDRRQALHEALSGLPCDPSCRGRAEALVRTDIRWRRP